eukprot:jgi/Ulvmu1/5131/UM021_0148.1
MTRMLYDPQTSPSFEACTQRVNAQRHHRVHLNFLTVSRSHALTAYKMVVFVLEVKADLENIATLELSEGYNYCIDVKNSTGEDQRDGVYVTSTNEEDLHGSRGTCNFQVKWVKGTRSSAYVIVHESVKGVTRRQITEQDSGQWTPIVGFDCRGLEPVGFHPENGWKAVSTGGTVFGDVDLREDWAEFCEKIAESVGVYSIESRFRRI